MRSLKESFILLFLIWISWNFWLNYSYSTRDISLVLQEVKQVKFGYFSFSGIFFFAIFWPSLQRGTFSWQSSGLWRSPKIAPLFWKPFQFRGIRSGLKLVLVYLLVLEEWKKKRRMRLKMADCIAWKNSLGKSLDFNMFLFDQ